MNESSAPFEKVGVSRKAETELDTTQMKALHPEGFSLPFKNAHSARLFSTDIN